MRGRATGLLLLALVPSISFAAPPGRNRVTWQTPHFLLTIDTTKSEILSRAGAILEGCWAEQTQFFDFEPEKKISCVFLDEDDYANGLAYVREGWIVIYLPGADFPLRGRTLWLPHVMSHELAHIITLRKMGIRKRYLYFDVFLDRGSSAGGRPSVDFRYYYNDVPPWLKEGLAQFGAKISGYDVLDTHREMLLRVSYVSGRMLSLPEMNAFAGDSREREQIYNQGFFFVSYLYEIYGAPMMNEMMSSSASLGYRRAIDRTFDKDLATLYHEWLSVLSRKYAKIPSPQLDDTLESSAPQGVPYLVERSPIFDSASRDLYFLSSRENDFGRTHLYRRTASGSTRLIKKYLRDNLEMHPGGKSILFCSKNIIPETRTNTRDLYELNLQTDNVVRKTRNKRIFAACYASGGRRIFALAEQGGSTVFAEVLDGELRNTFMPPGNMEFRDLSAGSDESTVFVVTANGFGSDVYKVNIDGHRIEAVLSSEHDERDPYWDGTKLFYAADYDGRFNIYSYDEGTIEQHTDVPGGAFTPFVAAGKLWFSEYGAEGYLLKAKELNAGKKCVIRDLAPSLAWSLPDDICFTEKTKNRVRLQPSWYAFRVGLRQVPEGSLEVARPNATINDMGYDRHYVASVGMVSRWYDHTDVSELRMRGTISQMFGIDSTRDPEVSRVEVNYSNRYFLPILSFRHRYISRSYPRLAMDERELEPSVSSHFTSLSATWRLATHWWTTSTIDNCEKQATDHNDSNGIGIGMGARLRYANHETGVDFINKGVEVDLEARYYLDVGEPQVSGDITLHGHLRRAVFFSLSGAHEKEFWGQSMSSLSIQSTARFRMPLHVNLGREGGRGIYFDTAYLVASLGHQRLHNDEGEVELTGEFENYAEVAIRLKTIALYRGEAWWRLSVRQDLDDLARDPILGLSISL